MLAKNIDPQDYRLQQEQKAIQERQFTLIEMGKEWLYLKKNEVDTGRLKEVTFISNWHIKNSVAR
ncbi:hypothetical protein [Haemophilus influenzae]|uniref:hypothetical protein n=1 Tax=Haemophilus influenzae TaxID=727 RepID=UPI000B2EE9E7|nr:hypothetical protein [Haemophilus influenzae]